MHTQFKNILYFLVVLFAGLTMCSGAYAETPDYPDTCSTTDYYDLALNSSIDGYIQPRDSDVFRITVPSPGTLTIYSSSTLPMDPVGELRNDRCKRIARHNDIDKNGSPPDYDFRIVKDVPAGEYFVRVRHDSRRGQGDYTLYVDFDGVTAHTITASNGAGGSMSPVGSVSVPHNGSQAFAVTPDACYSVQDVLVDGISVGAVTSYIFNNVTFDRTITANFAALAAYTINASAGANGSISPSGAVSVGCGADQGFSITPDPGYEVLDVLIDGVSWGPMPSHTFFNVTQNHSISASFGVIGDHIIHTYNGPNGSISPPGPVSVPNGGSQSFAITPQPGYQVTEVWVDGVSQGAVSAYTFNNVSKDYTLEAQFSPAAPPPDPTTCIDISDSPLDARFRSAPANIMFVMDDSGSMDWEIMTNESDGLFEGHRYIFDNPGDNLYSDSYILSGDDRKKWKSQWSEYNKMYYNPQTVYEPWPNKDPADVSNPRSHPHHATPTLNLSATFDSYAFGASEVIADEQDSGVFSYNGPWVLYTHSEAYNDLYYAAVDADTNFSAAWASDFTGGQYDVFTRYHANEWRSTAVPYTIEHSGGLTTVEVNQRVNGGQWVFLGTYNFPTNKAKVTIDTYVADPNADRVSADAIKYVPKGTISFNIPNAHYYVWSSSENKPYLVVIDGGSIDYYVFTDLDNDDVVDPGELVPNFAPPADVVSGRTYAEERQNFANWYSFYRRRELTATAAVAGVINEAGGVQIGVYGINEKIVQPVHKIHVDGVDETDTLLNHLYSMTLTANGTPLRRGVQNVGKYFDKTDSDTGGIGDSPYASADDGGECQQSFAIVMTDGYYNGSTEPWDPAANVDGDNGAPYADTHSNTLADVAMYYYENDLADLADSVPTNERDDATHQHMVTYTIGFGVTGTLNPLDYDFDNSIYPTWPAPTGNQEKIDDLWHASVNGRGRYLTANNAVELINDLLLILKDIEIFSGSASSVSVNGDELYMKINNDVLLFQSKYYSEGWHGDVLAYHVDPVSGELIEPAIWSAAHQMSLLPANNRKIATYDGISAGRPFRFDDLTDNQLTQLDINWQSDPTLAQNIVDYLRGDGANEVDNGGTFRNRTWTIVDPGHPYNGDTIASSKLGDIVHSSPVYKNGVLFSGGNDGMLHAFDAETGEELFAYVPNLIYGQLSELIAPDYAHKYYVDLTPTVEEIDVGGVTRMLVGGFGKGSIGYYALDVSNLSPADGQVPANENQVAAMVMWEYPNLTTPVGEIADLGYSFSRSTIVQTYDSANAPWVVIFGNGYNSPNGHAVLFILDPVTGQLIKRIDTGVGSCNGLSTPIATDIDYDNKVDFVYAGDLNGNMWKFDLRADDYNLWTVSYENAGTPKPLFKTAANQPITTRPDVLFHCEKPGYTVVFGTGRYLGDVDLSDTSQQAIYGIWDYGDADDSSEYVGVFNAGNLSDTLLPSPPVSVLPQTVVNQQIVNNHDIRTVSDNSADWTVTSLDGSGTLCGDFGNTSACDPNGLGTDADPIRNVGWYLNLDGPGERVVSDVLARDGTLIAISYIPSGNMCGTGGNSWLWALDACAGARLTDPVFDINGDGVIDDQDMVNIGTTTDPIWVPPTGIQYNGRLQPPAIIILDENREMLYMSSSKGEIVLQLKKAVKLGMTFWRVYRP